MKEEQTECRKCQKSQKSRFLKFIYSFMFLILLTMDSVTLGQHLLKSSKTHKKKFERAQTDVFDIETVNVGEIKKIK